MSTREDAAVLWFRPDLGEGAVQTDSGRHLRFVGAGPLELELGEKVLVHMDPLSVDPASSVRIQPLPHPKRFVVVEEVKVACATRALDAGEAPAAPEVGRSLRRSAPAAPSRRKQEAPRRAPGEALDRNTPVKHPEWGQGFVVMSTSRVARVRFGAEERSVRVADLELLDR